MGHKAEVPQSHACFLWLLLPQLNADPLPSPQLFPWDSHLCHQNILTPLLFLSAGFLSVLGTLDPREKKNKHAKRPCSLSHPSLTHHPSTGDPAGASLGTAAPRPRGGAHKGPARPSQPPPVLPLQLHRVCAPGLAEARGRRAGAGSAGTRDAHPGRPLPTPTPPTPQPLRLPTPAPGLDPRPAKTESASPASRAQSIPAHGPEPREAPRARPTAPHARGRAGRPPGRPALTDCRSRRYRRRSRPSCSRRWGRAGRSRSTFGCAGGRSCPAASSSASPPASASRWPPWPRRRARRPAGPGAGRRCAGDPAYRL